MRRRMRTRLPTCLSVGLIALLGIRASVIVERRKGNPTFAGPVDIGKVRRVALATHNPIRPR